MDFDAKDVLYPYLRPNHSSAFSGKWTYFLPSPGQGRSMVLSNANYMPTDIIYAILEQLADRRDLHAAALANQDFNRAATPLLYRTLDTDTRTGSWDHKAVRLFQLLLKLDFVLNLQTRLAT